MYCIQVSIKNEAALYREQQQHVTSGASIVIKIILTFFKQECQDLFM
jgi:hypothetical protein